LNKAPPGPPLIRLARRLAAVLRARLSPRHWFSAKLAIVALTGSIFIWLAFLPRPATYSMYAVTETASIIVRDAQGFALHLPDAGIWRRGTVFMNARQLCCSPVLQVADGVRVTLARKRSGDLLIQLNWSDGDHAGARIVDRDGKSTALENGDVLRVPLDRPSEIESEKGVPDTVLLSFRGELRVGDDVAALAERTLLSGSIKIVERLPGSDERYLASEATLDPGDAVVWRGPDRDAPVIVSGLVHVGSLEGLQVVAHAAADCVSIERFGAPSYQIRASSWERITREPLLGGIAAMIICIGALATVVDVLTKRWRSTREE
jgi:hypothetical protein